MSLPQKWTEVVEYALAFARNKHPEPFHSVYEGFGVLEKESHQLRQAIFEKRDYGSGDYSQAILVELASVAAMCQRMAEDLWLQKNA